MERIVLRIVNRSGSDLPGYATEGASGMDLKAMLDEPVTLGSLQRAMIPTGIFLEIPEGYEVQVRPRSGMAWKHGLTCLNSPGTVDSDYRGELKVIMINLSADPYTIQHGDRIAQMVVAKVEKAVWEETDDLTQSQRGKGGFGHTGMR